MKKVNYYLTQKQIAQLRALSSETGLTISEHIRRAIDAYLEHLKNKHPEIKEVLESKSKTHLELRTWTT